VRLGKLSKVRGKRGLGKCGGDADEMWVGWRKLPLAKSRKYKNKGRKTSDREEWERPNKEKPESAPAEAGCNKVNTRETPRQNMVAGKGEANRAEGRMEPKAG